MAMYPAIAATSTAIVRLLENAAATSPEFSSTSFELYQSQNFQSPFEGPRSKVSVYLYRIAVSSVRRHMGPRVDPTGDRWRPPIPLDLHYLVTAWAADAAMQHQLLGWTVRTLEDTPVIPSALLNAHQAGATIFAPTETVELVWHALNVQELSDVWDVARTNQQPSATYMARMVLLESKVPYEEGELVQTREFDYAGSVA